MPQVSDPNLLVGIETGDDAAVYRLTDELALVQTTDFFPPIVDDPYHFGAIAVANAISDVYAMGGTPLVGLNLVGFPVELSRQILGDILKGGYDKATEAGLLIIGGHTIDDKEPKYGLAVTGLVRPGEHVTNSNAQPGDVLVLTKPIGSGIITTAAKNDRTNTDTLAKAIEVMETLNSGASSAMRHVGVNACTDVTGFGLMGHLKSMMVASKTRANVYCSKVPFLDGAYDLAEQEIIPGGTYRNLQSLGEAVDWESEVSTTTQIILSDAQTSGGLLISTPASKLDNLLEELARHGVITIAVIGEVEDGQPGTIRVFP